ncbi:hypothetical protein BGZ72_000707, partial [Mortierella alpina]
MVLGDGEPTTVSVMHSGARLNGDIRLKNHHLKLAIASKQVTIKSSSHGLFSSFPGEHELLSVRYSKHYIINAPSTPYGDSFTGLDTRRLFTE